MKSPFFQFFCSSCFSCHDCLCGIAPAARPAQHFQFDLVLSAYVWHSAHRDQAAGKETKLNVESNCQQKKGENSSFNAERMSYRHNLANPAQIWFVSRAAAHRFSLMPNQVPTGPLTPLGVCMRSVEGHEKKFYHIFFIRNVMPLRDKSQIIWNIACQEMTALVLRATRLDVDQGPFFVPFLVRRCRSIKPNAQHRESERFFSLSKWMQQRKNRGEWYRLQFRVHPHGIFRN